MSNFQISKRPILKIVNFPIVTFFKFSKLQVPRTSKITHRLSNKFKFQIPRFTNIIFSKTFTHFSHILKYVGILKSINAGSWGSTCINHGDVDKFQHFKFQNFKNSNKSSTRNFHHFKQFDDHIYKHIIFQK